MNKITVFSNVQQNPSLGSQQALSNYVSSIQTLLSVEPVESTYISLKSQPPSRLRSFYVFFYLIFRIVSRFHSFTRSTIFIVSGAESFGCALLLKILFPLRKIIFFSNGPELRYNYIRLRLGLLSKYSPSFVFQNLCFRGLTFVADEFVFVSLSDKDWVLSTLSISPSKVSVFEPSLRPGFFPESLI